MAKSVNQIDQPNQSADRRYYASGQKSVISPVNFDTTKRRGKLTGNPTPRAVDPKRSAHESAMPRSSDVYYANDKQAVGQEFVKPTEDAAALSPPMPEGAVVVISESSTLRQRMEIVLDRVRLNQTPVRVRAADRELLRAARMFVEYAVTREEITEDQGREVQFGLLPKRQQTLVDRPSDTARIEKLLDLDLDHMEAFAPVASSAPTAPVADAKEAPEASPSAKTAAAVGDAIPEPVATSENPELPKTDEPVKAATDGRVESTEDVSDEDLDDSD